MIIIIKLHIFLEGQKKLGLPDGLSERYYCGLLLHIAAINNKQTTSENHYKTYPIIKANILINGNHAILAYFSEYYTQLLRIYLCSFNVFSVYLFHTLSLRSAFIVLSRHRCTLCISLDSTKRSASSRVIPVFIFLRISRLRSISSSAVSEIV